MTTQIPTTSFLHVLSLSKLLTVEQLKAVEQDYSIARDGRENLPTQEILIRLLKNKLITPWQAEKLIQGRFRGFFLGNYKLLNRVARGGMSTIYAAEDKRTGETHALKVLPLAKTNQAAYLLRFQREAAIAQRLNHPNVIRVFGIYSGTDGQADVHFMAMELLQGRDLFELVNADGPLPCRKAVEFIRQAALGLDHAHNAGLVHRDIKPGNLFLSDDQIVRILDLGLAQDFDSEESLTRELNERVLGTADYLSPEQAADTHAVDARTDIYSLGCTLYFLLTGQPPFTGGTLVQRLIAHQAKTPPSIREFREDIPDELMQIITKMMAKNREERISTAVEVVERLQRFLERTADQNELDATPIMLKRGAESKKVEELGRDRSDAITHDEENDARNQKNDSMTSDSVASRTHGLSHSDEQSFLPEFAVLLHQIEQDCDSEGKLAADSRSIRLLEVARELRQLASDSTTDSSGQRIQNSNEKVPISTVPDLDRIPDLTCVETALPDKWPAQDTVLNDIAMTGFRFDVSFKRGFDTEQDTKLIIEDMLAAVELDRDQPNADPDLSLLASSDRSDRRFCNVARRTTDSAKKSQRIGFMVGIGVALSVIATIVYALL